MLNCWLLENTATRTVFVVFFIHPQDEDDNAAAAGGRKPPPTTSTTPSASSSSAPTVPPRVSVSTSTSQVDGPSSASDTTNRQQQKVNFGDRGTAAEGGQQLSAPTTTPRAPQKPLVEVTTQQTTFTAPPAVQTTRTSTPSVSFGFTEPSRPELSAFDAPQLSHGNRGQDQEKTVNKGNSGPFSHPALQTKDRWMPVPPSFETGLSRH